MKKQLVNKWRRLDNTAKIFSLDHKHNTNIFRCSAVLKRKVNKSVLIQALRKTLESFSAFRVKLGSGIFWEYLEYNKKEVIVEEECGVPCQVISFRDNNDFLFKVTYYKEKINMEVFHTLTDGTGALKFFKALICNYINVRYKKSCEKEDYNKINYRDQYLQNYDRKLVKMHKTDFAYMLPGKVRQDVNNTYHYVVDVKEVKEVCKRRGVSISEYITAMYIFSLYLAYFNDKSKREIIVTVPIDLRKYYNCDTLSNFFACMDINAKIKEKNITTFEGVLERVHQEFKDKLTCEKVKGYLNRDVALGMCFPIRIAPLFIKKIFMRFMGGLFCKTVTSTMSNVGVIDFGEEYNKYIDNVFLLVLPSKIQKIKCTMCSFSNHLNITMNSNIEDIKFEKIFYTLLKKDLKKIKVINNTNVNLV